MNFKDNKYVGANESRDVKDMLRLIDKLESLNTRWEVIEKTTS